MVGGSLVGELVLVGGSLVSGALEGGSFVGGLDVVGGFVVGRELVRGELVDGAGDGVVVGVPLRAAGGGVEYRTTTLEPTWETPVTHPAGTSVRTSGLSLDGETLARIFHGHDHLGGGRGSHPAWA
jgi:hypothetical protein